MTKLQRIMLRDKVNSCRGVATIPAPTTPPPHTHTLMLTQTSITELSGSKRNCVKSGSTWEDERVPRKKTRKAWVRDGVGVRKDSIGTMTVHCVYVLIATKTL